MYLEHYSVLPQYQIYASYIIRHNGTWIIQYQWWPDTDKAMKMGFLMLPIPNTPYEVESFYPTRNFTEDQLNEFMVD